jgi:hypothetical protein
MAVGVRADSAAKPAASANMGRSPAVAQASTAARLAVEQQPAARRAGPRHPHWVKLAMGEAGNG